MNKLKRGCNFLSPHDKNLSTPSLIFTTKKGGVMSKEKSYITIPEELISKALYKVYLTDTHTEIIKDFLYKLYLGKLNDENIFVQKVLGIKNNFDPALTLPNINFNEKNGMYSFTDFYTFFSVKYKDESYELNFQTAFQFEFNCEDIFRKTFLFTGGTSKKAYRSEELTKAIISSAIANCSIHNKVVRFDREAYKGEMVRAVEFVNTPPTKTSDLFISADKKDQIIRFINSITDFDKNKISLRYLFNGKPGTGKTQIINSIITETCGKCTVVLCNGGSLPVKKLFEFCSYFNPCLLVIDDLDFLANDRENNIHQTELGDFLQALDGLLPNFVFLLSATNDKGLVDKAASRPGRFDMILDIAEIEPKNYLSLVKRETCDERIISLFDEDTLLYLKDRRVTGAFIVSLLKQIKSSIMLNGEISCEEFSEYLNLCYRGFYSINDDNFNNVVGFGT